VDITSGSITITMATSSESASHTTLKQYVRSTDGTVLGNIGFGIRNEFYGSNDNFYPNPFGAIEYTVSDSPDNFATKNTNYISYNKNFEKISEIGVNSKKEFYRPNSNGTHREYIMSGRTNGIQDIYLNIFGPPNDDFIDMPTEESWNFTVRIIARNTDALASDAFFINGYCDNTGVGTIVGQDVIVNEIGAANLVPNLNVDIQYDQNGGNNNYFRIQCESDVNAVIDWVAYIDIVAVYGIAGARPAGGNP
jgi:hypothetical protein